MKITCLTTFLDGSDRFEKDDVRTVDDTRGAYFVAQGWATADGVEVAETTLEVIDLTVQDGVMGQEANHG